MNRENIIHLRRQIASVEHELLGILHSVEGEIERHRVQGSLDAFTCRRLKKELFGVHNLLQKSSKEIKSKALVISRRFVLRVVTEAMIDLRKHLVSRLVLRG